MPKLTFPPNPGLTQTDVAAILQRDLPDCQVRVTPTLKTIIVQQTNTKGAALRLKVKDDKTTLVVNGLVPSFGMRLLLALFGVIPLLIFQFALNQDIVTRVQQTASAAPELQGGQRPVEAQAAVPPQ